MRNTHAHLECENKKDYVRNTHAHLECEITHVLPMVRILNNCIHLAFALAFALALPRGLLNGKVQRCVHKLWERAEFRFFKGCCRQSRLDQSQKHACASSLIIWVISRINDSDGSTYLNCTLVSPNSGPSCTGTLFNRSVWSASSWLDCTSQMGL